MRVAYNGSRNNLKVRRKGRTHVAKIHTDTKNCDKEVSLYPHQRDALKKLDAIDATGNFSGIISLPTGGGKTINVGKNLSNTVFYDYTGNVKETVYVDQDGNGIFYCNGGSVSVWVKCENNSIC